MSHRNPPAWPKGQHDVPVWRLQTCLVHWNYISQQQERKTKKNRQHKNTYTYIYIYTKNSNNICSNHHNNKDFHFYSPRPYGSKPYHGTVNHYINALQPHQGPVFKINKWERLDAHQASHETRERISDGKLEKGDIATLGVVANRASYN